MGSKRMRVLVTGVAAVAIGIYAEIGFSSDDEKVKNDPIGIAVAKGLKWLVSVQGKDGGWGQDGGETSYVRQGERLESNGNDVANTAVVAEALLQTGTTVTRGEYREPLQRAVDFVLKHVEQSPVDGLAGNRPAGDADPAKAGPVHRYVCDVEITGRIGWHDARREGQCARAPGFAEVRGEDRKVPTQGWKLEHLGRLGADSWHIHGIPESGHRAGEGSRERPSSDGSGGGVHRSNCEGVHASGGGDRGQFGRRRGFRFGRRYWTKLGRGRR